jgi:hypothetical protein
MYVFYIAVYGKNSKKQKNVTEHTNTDETEWWRQVCKS